MDAWGVSAYENEEAGDWLFGLDEIEELEPIRAALHVSEGPGGLIALRDAAIGLVAAELIAALAGAPAPEIPPDVRQWLVRGRRLHPEPEDVAAAIAAVEAAAQPESEVAQYWGRSGEDHEWHSETDDLITRLRSCTTAPTPG